MISKIILKDSVKQKPILNPETLFGILEPIRNEWQEHLVVIPLDSENKPLGAEVVAIGLENQVATEPRILFKKIFSQGKYFKAVSFAMAHNHPSGNANESVEDMKITRLVCTAGRIMKFPLIDHIIVTKDGFNSLNRKYPNVFENPEAY